MTKTRIKILFAVLLAGLAGWAGLWNKTQAQTGRDGFSHSSRSHQKVDCASCHKTPTGNWVSARGYPDVADYPGHSSCVQCHRNEFFQGNRPAICTVCHTAAGPRAKARFPFPMSARSQEFETIFPHDVHQNIIASNRKPRGDIAVAHFVNANYRRAYDDDEVKTSQFNNCTICHQTPGALPSYASRMPIKTELLADPVAETFTPRAEFFKDMPNTHASCFNCHYQGQQPIRTDCAGCHRLAQKPYFESTVVRRISLKFDHASENHANKDCTVCHVRITQTSDLRNLINADVPLLTCSSSSCHADVLKEEIGKRNDTAAGPREKIFQCNYCHSSDIGSYRIPLSHQNQ